VGTAAVPIAALVIGILILSNLHRGPTSAPSRATAGGSSIPDWFSALPFNCLGSTGLATGPAPAVAYVSAVGAGTQAGYDSVTIQFADGSPAQTTLSTQSGVEFTQGTSGQPVVLKGQAGALLTLHSTDGHTHYGGPTDIKTSYPVVLELRQLQDFEGTVQWAIGLSQLPCYRMAFLDKPTRLVIDFRAGSATS
jgi:hypothetical protein